MAPAPDVTTLLRAWRQGDDAALELLTPLVYGELHRRARHYLRGERRDHTLRPTALVHEVYLRLIHVHAVDWQDRSHFFAVAARQMRRILVDSARARLYRKRGGGALRVTLDDRLLVTERAAEIVALDDALDALAIKDPRKTRVVELRFFGGLNNDEIAAALGVSTDTVTRDWNMAKLWLRRQLKRQSTLGDEGSLKDTTLKARRRPGGRNAV